MNKILYLLIIFSIVNSQYLIYSENSNNNWKLIWCDDFLDTKIDHKKWDFDIGNGFMVGNNWIYGWGNNELEYYTDKSENISINNGSLVITALKDRMISNGQIFYYSAARIKTKGLFSIKYGKIEAKIKLPKGKGYWPAFWMLPVKEAYGKWAASGEIDIMEAKGSNISEISGTIHYGGVWPENKYSTKKYIFPKGQSTMDFHIYSIEWYPEIIKWFVDGVCYAIQDKWYSQSSRNLRYNPFPSPFDQEFYIIINLAIGGNYDGSPNSNTIFPQNMEIDYVKVYKKEK